MEFKIKDMDIATGGVQVVLLNEEDALTLDLHHKDRLNIKKGQRKTTAVLDIAESEKFVKPGQIGMFEEVLDILRAEQGDKVDIAIKEKPLSVKYIKQKLNGQRLKKNELNEIIRAISENELTDVEVGYFIASSYIFGLDDKETYFLTKAMIENGDKLNLPQKIIVDKHCTGGVAGNRTTPLIVPIMTAAGYIMPKTSSRAITSPAGTADTIEVLSSVDFGINDIKRIVKKTNGCIVWGGSLNLAPSDDSILRVEAPLSIDAEGQLLASILAKKGSVSSTHVLIDIALGKETKITSRRRAQRLKKRFIALGKRLGMKIRVILTNGNEPIGYGIGPILEARDILKVLRKEPDRPLDLEKKVIFMAGHLFDLVEKKGLKKGKEKARAILDSGQAYEQFKKIIKAQKGNPHVLPQDLKLGKYSYTLKAPRRGTLVDIDNRLTSRIAKFAGAPLDKGAGVYLYKHEKEKVVQGEPLLTIYAQSKTKLNFAKNLLKDKPIKVR